LYKWENIYYHDVTNACRFASKTFRSKLHS